MKRIKPAPLTTVHAPYPAAYATLVLVALVASAATAVPARAQSAPKDSGAPMVKAPDAASASNPANPDHMPVKRPDKPTNDRMTHTPPASAANAK
ncbi:hypothetical protein [Paraburkholderia sp.]|uniref:hypothetical protein n=1 Tax=Paraburkholderia sp. TaxID=1926495 RepID=UPI002F4064A1